MTKSESPSENTLTGIDLRVLGYTLVFFGLAVVSRDVLFAIPFYESFWKSAPEFLYRLENPVRWTLICLLGLYAAHRLRPMELLRELGLTASLIKPLVFAFIACSPMLIVPALTGKLNPEFSIGYAMFGAGIWPLAEEILFRGYAFRQLHERARLGFWSSAILIGVVFGALHLGNASVQQLPLSGELGAVAIVSLGGILFAWIYVRWDNNLWAPFGLHLFMNLWWDVFSMDESPLGGWLPNVLRLMTAILAIGLTIYRDRIPFLRNSQYEKEPLPEKH